MRLRAQRSRHESAIIPPPLGGWNTVDAITAMPPTDCIYAYNLMPAEYGLRSRLGFREWVLNLGNPAPAAVRAILPFTGSKKDGSVDKLFATTTDGIWDASASTDAPTRLVAFGTANDDSGWGIATGMTTSAGHFLLYADEGNGYFLYSETAAAWEQIVLAATVAWAGATAYAVGDRRTNDGGKTYVCTVAGTSAGAGGPTGAGAVIVDGGATWRYANTITGVDPARFAFVLLWKNRLWFVERESAVAWYLPIGSLYGAATRFDFGNKFTAGGQLAGLWSWTIDGGAGIDDHLVAISTAGDVLIYQGTDPSDAAKFALRGSWFVGGVPAGRRIASSFGGDLHIISLLGVVPLSRLLQGGELANPDTYASAKIRNVFAADVAARKAERAWGLHIHPEDASLIVLLPDLGAQTSQQFAMSIPRKSWWRYRGLPMLSAASWKGKLYFGTPDGRVCVNDGYADDVPYGGGAGTEIEWSSLLSFQNMGSARLKKVQFVVPQILAQGASPAYEAQARYGFDFGEIAGAPVAPPSSASALWDAGVWDSAVWSGGEYVPGSRVGGATGIGADVAIAIRGSSSGRVILAGVKVIWETGGLL